MEDQEDKPKWLVELENRKRKPKLAHEAGAGAPCLNCESACPGLDLHFWRKICKNCKCRGDNHDVDDEDFPQFELLFGPGLKRKSNRSVVLKVNNKKQVKQETPFEWVPPDITKELAEDYMNALPSNKLPIKGSTGAALRRQQLQKQLPLHDIDYKACDNLSEQEKQEFNKYLDNLKKSAGQGKVSKLTTIKPFDKSFMTPVNATDVQQFSPQHSQSLMNPNAKLNLRTPSSFIPKNLQVPLISNLPNFHGNVGPIISSTPCTKDVIQVQSLQAQSEPYFKQPEYESALKNSNQPNETCSAPQNNNELQFNSSIKKSNKNWESNPICHGIEHVQHSSIIASEEYPQTSQPYQSVHLNNKNPNMRTDIIQNLELLKGKSISAGILQQTVSSKDLLLPSSMRANKIKGGNSNETRFLDSHNEVGNQSSNKDDCAAGFVSSNIESIRHYPLIFNSLEIANNPEISKSFGNKTKYPNHEYQVPSNPPTSPTKHLNAELNTSLPIQSNVIHSELLNNPIFPENSVNALIVHQNLDNISQLQNEMEGLTMNANKIYQCHNCQENIHCGDVVVTAEKIKEAAWHPGCFVCSACNELLVDLVYFSHKDKLYCARDFAEYLDIPRCFACDELIFVREYTVAEGHNYHVKHFCCWDCDIPLAERQYLTENDRPVCLSCYQNNYAQTCNACNNVIAADQQGVTVKDLHFHVTENCFCCTTCKKSLLGGKISVKENKLLCSKECIAEFLHRKAFGR
ncbi:testin [Phymastichus coffea]|uniref:testin n=1 Tax=Phymastichus coffea TaxID=108790 RepID=UPI00273C1238|nr:testin [Phymastichus coffea]